MTGFSIRNKTIYYVCKNEPILCLQRMRLESDWLKVSKKSFKMFIFLYYGITAAAAPKFVKYMGEN